MINKGFYKRWFGLDEEKNNINQTYPNQLRDSDTYFAYDTELFYYRYNNEWRLINKNSRENEIIEHNIDIVKTIENNETISLKIGDIKGYKNLSIYFKQQNEGVLAKAIYKNTIKFENDLTKEFIKAGDICIFSSGNIQKNTIKSVSYNEYQNETTITVEKKVAIDEINISKTKIYHSYTIGIFDIILSSPNLNEIHYSNINSVLYSSVILNQANDNITIGDTNTVFWCENALSPVMINNESNYVYYYNDNSDVLKTYGKNISLDSENLNYITMVNKIPDNLFVNSKKSTNIIITNKSGVKREVIITGIVLKDEN